MIESMLVSARRQKSIHRDTKAQSNPLRKLEWRNCWRRNELHDERRVARSFVRLVLKLVALSRPVEYNERSCQAEFLARCAEIDWAILKERLDTSVVQQRGAESPRCHRWFGSQD